MIALGLAFGLTTPLFSGCRMDVKLMERTRDEISLVVSPAINALTNNTAGRRNRLSYNTLSRDFFHGQSFREKKTVRGGSWHAAGIRQPPSHETGEWPRASDVLNCIIFFRLGQVADLLLASDESH